MGPNDIITDDPSSTLRATADLFEQSAEASNDPLRRETLRDFAKLYREMAVLADASDSDTEDDLA